MDEAFPKAAKSGDEEQKALRGELDIARALARARKRQVDLVAAVGRALVARGTFMEQLRGSVDAIALVVEAERVEVWTRTRDDDSLELLVSTNASNDPGAQAERERLAREALFSEREGSVFAHGENNALAAFPLVVAGETWGVIAVVAIEQRVRDALDGLRVITDQIALALARSRSDAAAAAGASREEEHKVVEAASLRAMAADLERRVAERTRDLEETNHELESFSYSVSHDLRAPIRHISGFADMLQRHCKGQLDARGEHYLDTISSAARQAGALIDDLLSFSRVSRSEIVRKTVSLGELVESARQEIVAEAGGRPIEWQIGKLPSVMGDPAMLRIVVRNLLSNAVKYTRRALHPRVEIGSSTAGDEVSVFVRDNGVGFDMKHAHKLFGVFQRLHRSDEFEGTGIGLATVRRIVQRHGGRTSATAVPGEGAAFTFTLPRMENGPT